MLLYKSAATTFEVACLELTFEDDALAAACVFEPEFVMAEHPSENAMALEIAMAHWAGLGLIEPDVTQLPLHPLDSLQAKIFLLCKDNESQAVLSDVGLVVHDRKQYQLACLEALNNVLT